MQLTTKNVRDAKEALNRALKAPVPSLTDLFDIYSELIEVGTNLDGFSDQILMFSDGNANSYAQASAKASVLAANLGNAIRFRIVLVEANCSKQK